MCSKTNYIISIVFQINIKPQTRDWCDKQVISHLAFIPSIPIAIFYRQPSFPEPLFFIIPLLILSTLYHRHHEPIATPLSRTEMAAAFSLYFYGCAQLFYSPSWTSLILCSMCFLVTSIVYILTNPLVNKIDWDIWHYIGMHIVPGVWASVVAFYNFPIFI